MKSFVAYALPGQIDYVYADIDAVSHTSSVSGNRQFLFAPFDSQRHPDLHFKLGESKPSFPFTHSLTGYSTNEETSIVGYQSMFDKIHASINGGQMDKVVLSRIKKIRNEGIDAADLFRSLVKEYAQAFVYIIHHPLCGTWIGASPEIIIQKEEDDFLTQAIAGTLPNTADSQWTKKERQEHDFILQHLNEALDNIGCRYRVGDTFDLVAGSIKHLKTDVRIDGLTDMKTLLKVIHPGPALNGYPMGRALDLIRETESHDRKFYCGIIGPIMDSAVNLFANIRCMQCHVDTFDLFLGGGIVPGSTEIQEWEETEMKSETLSRFLLAAKTGNAFS